LLNGVASGPGYRDGAGIAQLRHTKFAGLHDHTSLFEPDFKLAVTSLDRKGLNNSFGWLDEQITETDAAQISAGLRYGCRGLGTLW
jgi:hypothetical protein